MKAPPDEVTSATTAGFIGSGRDRLFGSFTVPLDRPEACLLISSSLFAEQARNYRREVILARELGARGIATFRYHYRGTGHSGGEPDQITLASMCADASEAFDHVQNRFPGIPYGFAGTRLGGFVAASVARAMPVAPLLLWDPVASAESCFQDAIKARGAGAMVTSKHAGILPPAEDDIWASGFFDCSGYRVRRDVFDSFAGVLLADFLGAGERSVLIVSVVPKYVARPEADAVATLVRERTRWTVEVRKIEGRLSWWTARDSWTPEEDHPVTREVIAGSADWIERSLGVGAWS